MQVFLSYFCNRMPVCWCRDCLWTVLLVLKSLCRPLSCDIAWIRLFSVPLAGLITDKQIDSPYICPEVLSFSLSYFQFFILFSIVFSAKDLAHTYIDQHSLCIPFLLITICFYHLHHQICFVKKVN